MHQDREIKEGGVKYWLEGGRGAYIESLSKSYCFILGKAVGRASFIRLGNKVLTF